MNLFEALTSIYGQAAYPVSEARYAVSHADSVPTRARAERTRSEAVNATFAALGKAWRKLQERRQERAATRALLRLDDRLLADIGVSRGDIPYLIVHGLNRKAANDDRPALAACG